MKINKYLEAFSFVWEENELALVHNLDAIRSLVDSSVEIIKSEGYGFEVVPLAKALILHGQNPKNLTQHR